MKETEEFETAMNAVDYHKQQISTILMHFPNCSKCGHRLQKGSSSSFDDENPETRDEIYHLHFGGAVIRKGCLGKIYGTCRVCKGDFK